MPAPRAHGRAPSSLFSIKAAASRGPLELRYPAGSASHGHLQGALNDHRRNQEPNRPHLGRLLVRRHLESAGGDRADHLPALHPPARRPAHAGGEQGQPAQEADGAADLPGRQGRQGPRLRGLALVALQALRPGRDVHRGRRARLPVPAHDLAAARQRRLHLRAPHEGRALHHPDAGAAGQGGGHARPRADGGPRHQGRRLRVHARQDRHRRAERPVPHAAPHHPADGRADRAAAQRRHLRPGLRHGGLPGRGGRIPARAPPESAARRRSCASTSTTTCSTASTSTTPCCASAA